MTFKLSTIIVGSAFAAGTVIAVCVAIRRNSLPPCDQWSISNVKVEAAVHCKYIYDEMAHKLVAYSEMERCAASQRTFSNKLGSRMLELTKDAQSATRIITL